MTILHTPVRRPVEQPNVGRSNVISGPSTLLIRSMVLLMVLVTALPARSQCTGPATITFTGLCILGSNIITDVTPSTAGLSVGMPLTSSGIPGGTTIASIVNSTTFTMSSNAISTGTVTIVIQLTNLVPDEDWQAATVPGEPSYPFNFPPSTMEFCEVCPSLFTVDICGNEYAQMYLCAGNVYTMSMCASTDLWNSTISITGNTLEFPATDGSATFDDDGCGVPDGHAQSTYTPTTSGLRFIRILNHVGGNPCIPNNALCGTLSISCATAPTSVPDRPVDAMLVLWPNPARDVISLRSTDTSAYLWQLIDARGSLIRSGNHTGDLNLSLNDLPNGLYLLQTRTNDGVEQEHRWLKE
jgi:hypothetical protein